jgi:hypothetical protein
MKFKHIALIIIALLVCTPGQAQIRFGIRGGIGSSNIKLNDFNNPDYSLDYKSSKVGFHFGGVMQLKLGMFVLQPELLFSNLKSDLKLNYVTIDSAYTGSQSFNRIDIPVIAGVKFGPLKLQLGPVASVVVNSKSSLLDRHGIKQTYKGMTIGYQAGVGLELGSLLLDVKYEGSLSKFADGITIGGENFDFDQRVNQVILSLGFLF